MRFDMKRYIILLKFTEAGRKAVRESTTRAGRFTDAARKAGVEVEGQYWTTGRYDGVLILRAADERQVFRVLSELAAAGNVRTETMQAFVADEFSAIVGPA
jgi:uncharacterized protein with GYD domain